MCVARVVQGSSLHMALPDASVQCVVTSPPYWGLRKYEGEQDSGGFVFGLEKSPEAYVEHTVLFLREIRRVLKDDGCVFWVIADSYSGSGEGGGGNRKGNEHGQHDNTKGCRPKPSGLLKPKDLCLIPARVSIAAQADGWWVRSDIIWAKPNPMPESVTDRPTRSHEHIFMFTKNASYYWDQDAVREGFADERMGNPGAYRWSYGGDPTKVSDETVRGNGGSSYKLQNEGWNADGKTTGRNLRDVWTIATQPSGFKHYAAFPLELPTRCIKASTRPGNTVLDPFCGTGRTLYAALKLGRNAVGYDLSEKYCEMSTSRCREVQPILTLRPMGNTIK